MNEVWLAALVLAGLAWVWMTTLQARESARACAARWCRRQSLQLLDATVVPRAMRLIRAGDGLKLQREFGFEVSTDRQDRNTGRIWMLGGRPKRIELQLPDGGSLFEEW